MQLAQLGLFHGEPGAEAATEHRGRDEARLFDQRHARGALEHTARVRLVRTNRTGRGERIPRADVSAAEMFRICASAVAAQGTGAIAASAIGKLNGSHQITTQV